MQRAIKNKTESKSQILALNLAYLVAFQVVFQTWITSIYGYEGYTDNFSVEKFIASALMLLFLLLLAKNDSTPSSTFTHFIICIIFIPSCVIYAGQDFDSKFITTTFVAISIIIISAKYIVLKPIKTPRIDLRKILPVLLAIAIATVAGIIIFGGYRYLNFDMSKIYEERRNAADAIPGIFGYLNSITTKVVIPFAIVISIVQKKWSYLLILLGISFLFFGLTQHKAPLFIPLVVVFFYMASGHSGFKKYTSLTILIIIVFSGIDFWWFSNSDSKGFSGWFGALFSNRVLLVPAKLNSLYIDYFSGLDKYYWANSKISLGLVASPHSLVAPNLIGYEYFGNSEMSANTGWIGSGFANAGYFGVALYSLIIGLWLSLLDTYSKKIGARVVISLFSIQIFTFVTSTDFTDMLLTHGLIFSIFILLIIRFENRNKI